MKNIFKNRIRFLIALTFGALLITSCGYKLIRDAPWPDQLIYMPAAVYNNFTIDAVPAAIGFDPTPGYPSRFLIDTVARKFNVLLGAYRSGVTNNGSFIVDIGVNTDTITKLQAIAGKLPVGTLLLTSEKYTIASSVKMEDGNELAKFDLIVNLDTLLNGFASTKIYALGVGISSTARKTNPKFATTIIVVNTKFMKPTASFTSAPSGTVPKTINFTNTSINGTRFIWDFGDGTANQITTTAKNETVSHTYAAAGTYTITLTVQGVADWADRSVFTAVRIIL